MVNMVQLWVCEDHRKLEETVLNNQDYFGIINMADQLVQYLLVLEQLMTFVRQGFFIKHIKESNQVKP